VIALLDVRAQHSSSIAWLARPGGLRRRVTRRPSRFVRRSPAPTTVPFSDPLLSDRQRSTAVAAALGATAVAATTAVERARGAAPRPVVAGVVLALAVGLGGAVVDVTGTFDGTIGGLDSVTWQLAEHGHVVTGTGQLRSAASATAVTYAVRGVIAGDQLTLRLVGAPGDDDADSVVYSGRRQSQYYVGLVFEGLLSGGRSSPLHGELAVYRR
jgi:hypothetical protein